MDAGLWDHSTQVCWQPPAPAQPPSCSPFSGYRNYLGIYGIIRHQALQNKLNVRFMKQPNKADGILPTGKSLPCFLPHPLPTSVSWKADRLSIYRQINPNSINMGRKLHFLVSIIDKKDALIYKARRKAHPSAQADEGCLDRKEARPSLSVHLPFIRNCFSRGFSLSPCPGSWAPAA